MNRSLGIMMALLLLAATTTFAQDSAPRGATTGTATVYQLRDVYPKLKTMIDQEILVVGMPEKDARIRVWITLVDDIYKIPVLRDFPITAVFGPTFFSKKIELKGKFIYDAKLGYVFLATAYKSL